MFFNIEYTGLDLRGNRYLLKSEKARLDEFKPEIVYMETVHAIFYFKDKSLNDTFFYCFRSGMSKVNMNEVWDISHV